MRRVLISMMIGLMLGSTAWACGDFSWHWEKGYCCICGAPVYYTKIDSLDEVYLQPLTDCPGEKARLYEFGQGMVMCEECYKKKDEIQTLMQTTFDNWLMEVRKEYAPVRKWNYWKEDQRMIKENEKRIDWFEREIDRLGVRRDELIESETGKQLIDNEIERMKGKILELQLEIEKLSHNEKTP